MATGCATEVRRGFGDSEGRVEMGKKKKSDKLTILSWDFVMHEWDTPRAEMFYRLSGIKREHWLILLKFMGAYDGRCWRVRDIAAAQGVHFSRIAHLIGNTIHLLDVFMHKKRLLDEEQETAGE